MHDPPSPLFVVWMSWSSMILLGVFSELPRFLTGIGSGRYVFQVPFDVGRLFHRWMCDPLYVFWGWWGVEFLVCFDVWGVFVVAFVCVLVLYRYWIATVLFEWLVGVVSGCF